MSITETSAPIQTVPERITIVLRAQEGSTLEHICQFVSLGMPVAIGRGMAVIAGASDSDMVTPGLDDEFSIDDHVRLVADAKRYRWLRDRNRVTDIDTALCVARDDTVFFGYDLDKNVDDEMRLARLGELHP